MELEKLTEKAMEIRTMYAQLAEAEQRKRWTGAELAQGFVGDVGDLMKLVMAKEGLRKVDNVDVKLRHELADCLWSVLVIANQYEIDIEGAFFDTMQNLESRLQNQ